MVSYLNELRLISSNPGWADPAYIENSVCRYNQWLVIRAKANQPIPLPLEIKFMLHPYDYQRVSTALFGGVRNMEQLISLNLLLNKLIG